MAYLRGNEMTAILEEKATACGTLTIPDIAGIKVLTWDPSDDEQVREASEAFRAAQKAGMVAHQAHLGGVAADGTMGTVVREFPAEAASIMMRPQLVGG
jgi:hypothetical protein